jgi:hypothetical protein
MIKRSNMAWILTTVKLVVALALVGWGGWTLYQSSSTTPTQGPQTTATPTAGEPTKKTEEEKAAYTVPADHPRHLTIATLGVDANVLPMGVTTDNTIDAPASAWDVGWYDKSALPTSEQGSMIIDGHVNDTLNKPGVFYSIANLTTTDTIIIERGDLQKITYRVTKIEQKPMEMVNIEALKGSIDGKAGLHLITCSGSYDQSRRTYNDRVIVSAVRI